MSGVAPESCLRKLMSIVFVTFVPRLPEEKLVPTFLQTRFMPLEALKSGLKKILLQWVW